MVTDTTGYDENGEPFDRLLEALDMLATLRDKANEARKEYGIVTEGKGCPHACPVCWRECAVTKAQEAWWRVELMDVTLGRSIFQIETPSGTARIFWHTR